MVWVIWLVMPLRLAGKVDKSIDQILSVSMKIVCCSIHIYTARKGESYER